MADTHTLSGLSTSKRAWVGCRRRRPCGSTAIRSHPITGKRACPKAVSLSAPHAHQTKAKAVLRKRLCRVPTGRWLADHIVIFICRPTIVRDVISNGRWCAHLKGSRVLLVAWHARVSFVKNALRTPPEVCPPSQKTSPGFRSADTVSNKF